MKKKSNSEPKSKGAVIKVVRKVKFIFLDPEIHQGPPQNYKEYINKLIQLEDGANKWLESLDANQLPFPAIEFPTDGSLVLKIEYDKRIRESDVGLTPTED